MIDPKKVSAKSAAKPSAAAKIAAAKNATPKSDAPKGDAPKGEASRSAMPKSVVGQARTRDRDPKPDLLPAPALKKPAIAAATVAPAAAKASASPAPRPPVKIGEPASPVLSVSRPTEPEVARAAPEVDTAAVEAAANSMAPKAAALRQAMGESVKASATGALAVNDKVIEALQTQSHAALDLWRTTVSTPQLSDVFRLQTTGARQAYETATAQWKDIAETTAHWFNKTVEPLSTAISDLRR